MKVGVILRKRFKRRVNKKITISLFLIFSVIVSSVIYLFMQPVIMRFAVSTAETIMLNSANEAIINILEKGNITYKDIVNLSNNNDGYVTSLEIDVFQVNNLKSKISGEISRIIEERERYDISIPIGTFFGNSYTTGWGPPVKLKMQITTTAIVDFNHVFKSAGINQVLHIVNVKIDIKGSFVIAGYNKSVSTSTTAIVAQTVIVGKTPDAFTNVIESQTDNTSGLINDYGADAK